jgi:MYXO-CTERM domain-containing protein
MYAWLARWLRDESVGDTLPDPPGVFDGMPLWPTDALRVTIPAGDPSLLAETHGLRGGLPGLARPTTPEAWDAQADAIRASVADLAAWPGSTEPLAVTPGAPGDNPETIVIEPEDLAVDVTSDDVTHTWDSVLTATLRKPGTSAPWPCVILMNPVEIAAGDADYEALYTPISETSVVNALVAAGYAVLSLPQRFTSGPLPGAAYADQYAFESAVSRALNWYGTPVFGRHVHDVSVTLSVLAARADIVPERISVWGIGPAGPIALTAGMRDARLCQVAADRGLLSWDRESTDRHPVWSYPPKLLTAADAAHVASTIAPRRLVVTGSRDDLRVALSTSQTAARMDWATGAYAARGVPRQLRLIAGAGGIAGVTALSPSCGPASLGPIELYSLRADYVDRKVRVSWETTVEPDVQGYHVRRSEAQGGPYARVSTTMTAPVGDANHGGAYAFDDAGVATGKTYYYTIEAVPTMGASVEYGPVQIVIPRPGGCGVLAGDAAGGTLVLTLLAIALIARRRRR